MGRSKLESRPMMSIGVRVGEEGTPLNIMLQVGRARPLCALFLPPKPGGGKTWTSPSSAPCAGSPNPPPAQNAETVKLVAAGDSSGGGPGIGWRALSVSELQAGDEVLVHMPHTAARHMGVAIEEFVHEQ